MRKAFLILPIAVSCVFLACQEKTASSGPGAKVDSVFMLSPNGLGELKMGMKVDEIEKIIGEKVTMMNKNPEVWIDSAEVKYKGEPVTLFFDRRYEPDETFYMILGGIKSSGEKVKTGKGIGVGSDKEDIWQAYRDGYDMNLYRDYEDSTYTSRSKSRSFIYVTTGEGDNAIIFALRDNKVYRIELNRNYDDEE